MCAGSCVNPKTIFQSTRGIKSSSSFLTRTALITQQSRIIYRANCWDSNGFYIGNKRQLQDTKTERFKALAKNDNTSAIADHVKTTGHNIKWDRFEDDENFINVSKLI